MASHVPFLAVRPDEQFSTEIRSRDSDIPNAIEPIAPMEDAPPALTNAPRIPSAFSLPPYVRFPLIVLTSFTLSFVLHTFSSEVSGYQLATASRDATENWQIGALVGWKLIELATAWYAGYDYEDLAALTLLTNQPFYYLLYTFWNIQLIPVLISLSIDVTAIALPFALMRPHTNLKPARTNNQALATDWQVLASAAGLATAVYALNFYICSYANLGVFLIKHFDYVPTMELAHDSTVFKLMQIFFVGGIGATQFLFRPTIAATGSRTLTESKSKSRRAKKFHPETATLAETFAYNLGYGETGFSHRAEVLAKRTAVLAACTLANTFVRVFGTVQGTDVMGSLGYAALWAGAHGAVGFAYGWLSVEE